MACIAICLNTRMGKSELKKFRLLQTVSLPLEGHRETYEIEKWN